MGNVSLTGPSNNPPSCNTTTWWNEAGRGVSKIPDFFFYSVTGAKRVMYRSGEGKGGVDNVMGERAHVKNGCRGQEKREGKTLVP